MDIDLRTLARLLAGEATAEDLQERVVPHLQEICETCNERVDEIRRMQERFEHWNEVVVVEEGLDAPAQLEELMALGPEERFQLSALDESFHTWGLTQWALEQSKKTAAENPSRAVELGELAFHLVHHLPAEVYHVDWYVDLRARAGAHLGNARRLLGELRSAEADLRLASFLLRQGGTGRPEVEAEVLSLMTSLCCDLQRWDEALKISDRAFDLYHESGDLHQAGRVLIHQARVLEESGQIPQAIELLQRIPALLDPEREPRLPLCVAHNHLCCLIELGHFEEARDMMPRVREVAAHAANDVDRMRLRWLGGRISHGLKELDRAETIFQDVYEFFLDRRLDLEAAVAALDLALLYAKQERHDELQMLGLAIVPLFESQDLHRETLAVLQLFREAARQQVLTGELVEKMFQLLSRERCGRQI